MNVVALLTVAVLVGWIATLIPHDDGSLSDFAIGIAGAALAGGLLAPSLGISPTGDYGLSLYGDAALLGWRDDSAGAHQPASLWQPAAHARVAG